MVGNLLHSGHIGGVGASGRALSPQRGGSYTRTSLLFTCAGVTVAEISLLNLGHMKCQVQLIHRYLVAIDRALVPDALLHMMPAAQ